jgi:hypothetical protein
MRYHLEICGPGEKNVLASFTSDSPFMTINRGDIFNPLQWDCGVTDGRLQVVNVEHGIWKSPDGQMSHKMLVDVVTIPTDVAYGRVKEAAAGVN